MARTSARAAGAVALAGAGAAAWALFEAQWLETGRVEVAVRDLPASLDGLSILHLSDFHVGTPSLNARSLRKAVDFGVAERPDLVVVTGDIVNHPRGEAAVVEQLERLAPRLGILAVLGNHDLRTTKDPFSRGHVIEDWGDAPVRLLRDESVVLDVDGQAVEIAGLDTASWIAGDARPHELFNAPGAFRILLSHYPDAVELLPPGACSLVLAGHLHGGQIALRAPGVGAIRSPHEDWRYVEGVHEVDGTTLVVSRGTGTTLVPFRFMARPEASVLRLRPGGGDRGGG